ncbi:DEAD/DEAH box helicase [Cocleimonas sp. KMM 6892]|uniref:DEAD/DEAH box helicase n=1 Tax=unclassified Cocleimonas TaxID=2639732 RepID=UPI002DB9EED2|nr:MULTISPECIES: DEAD/DEAH box helicase [unclassified Cocleimonas]MEB8432077.1 DEAD/DEAH box helicase [Cocleimonas sp. KMM 6892]MEC4714837.1 DEAD/DEAH box helicase [Cocleimonas sp. KMM 6895]MEC4744349.1 DEAD/DEAH box helicase [Cocleimonas sp. KMM 6896]
MSHQSFDPAAFRDLPKLQRALIQILAIVYAPVAATPLASCAHRLGIDDPNINDSFTLHSLRPILVDLIHDNWVEGSQGKYMVPAEIRDDILLSAIEEGVFNAYADQVLQSFSATESFGRILWQSVEHGLSHARIYLFQGKTEKLDHTLALLFERYQYRESELINPGFYPSTFGSPANPKLLSVLSDEMFSMAFIGLSEYSLDGLHKQSELWELLEERKQNIPNLASFEFQLLEPQARYSILSGNYELFPKLPPATSTHTSSMLSNDENKTYDDRHIFWHLANSARQLVHSNNESAIQAYDNATDIYREVYSKRKNATVLFGNELEKFYLLALITSGDTQNLAVAQKIFKLLEQDIDHQILSAYTDTVVSGIFNFNASLKELESNTYSVLFYALIKHWLGQKLSDGVQDILEAKYNRASNGQYLWLKAEYAHALGLFAEKQEDQEKFKQEAEKLHQQLNTSTLFDLVKPQAEWERALNAMNQLVSTDKPLGGANDEERVVWMLDVDKYNEYSLTPKLQKRTAAGGWTKGRNIALKRLKKERQELPQLSEQDLDLVSAIFEQPDYDAYYHRGPQFTLDLNSAWPKLVNHPNLYWDGARNTPIELSQGEFELLVSEENENLRISFYPAFDNSQEDSQYLIVKETPTRLCIYQKNEQVMRLSEIISNGIVIPREAEKDLRETLGTLAPMISIQSDLEGVVDAEEIEPDSRIHANLLPYGEGLRATLRVKPFGEFGAYFPPGHGRAKLSIEHEGQRYKTTRDLEKEKDLLDSLLQHSSILGEEDEFNDEYLLDEPQDCLELLEQLHREAAAGEDGEEANVIIAWPEGEVMRIASHFDTNNLRLSINKSGDWFSLEGTVSTDPNLIVSLKQLLNLSANNKGRFLKMEDGQYLSLTHQFRKKLDSIHRYAEIDGDGARISGLASLALEDLTDMVGELSVDEAWEKHIRNIEELDDHNPQVPSTLQTELREYQEDGYKWMSRLAKWGVGACLADDMGLGKTVQTISILLERASLGPVLVVAPTSVSNNWESEILKFSPTLKPHFYREGCRKTLLENAGAFDVVIASYGLLQQDAEEFIEKKWGTIVLDEAQAIKNINAKRTKTAHKLQGDFKLVTTGTPIENHLGELWSIFRFLNPGLLGTQQQFMQHYISPIEKDNDADARNHLKKLIQPFILRRTKTQVLDELPPKTEITLEIPLSEGERSLYEAVRSSALENLAQDKSKPQSGEHLKVLAAITKLRLASCHPKLVMEDSTLSSSKLDRFGELLEELIENNHKALVFSQFVKYLSIIRAYLDERGIKYQYLDGSTPVAQRKARVDAFQDGEGELFLISLKAGGSGLNLTAADYVIHMDPWWNPAVENQASDRAHRIGQTRPVTIYRLVAENTIEQKIVKLHQHKRDLAESLLEGSDMSGSMSSDQMLELMREN